MPSPIPVWLLCILEGIKILILLGIFPLVGWLLWEWKQWREWKDFEKKYLTKTTALEDRHGD